MSEINYNRRLRDIEQLLRAKKHAASVRECGQVFEVALRELLQRLINDLEDLGKRDEILAAERSVAKGTESFKKFGLGQLVGLYAEGKVFEKLRSHLVLSLQKVRRISWNDVVALRNEATHSGSDEERICEEDALQMYFWVKVFLYDTGLVEQNPAAGSPSVRASSPANECPECKHNLETNWRFCPLCGAAVHAVCLSCGANLAPAYKICPYCEAPTRGATVNARIIHEYELLFRGAYLDMVITAQERAMLEQKRLELGLSVEQANEIEQRCIPRNVLEYYHLVEGVFVDGVINDLERSLLDKRIQELKIDPKIASCIEDDVRRNYSACQALGS